MTLVSTDRFSCFVPSVPATVTSMHANTPFFKSKVGAGVVASAAVAAAATVWYASRSPPVKTHPGDQQAALPSGLLAPVKFKVPLVRMPLAHTKQISLSCWPVLHSSNSTHGAGTLETDRRHFPSKLVRMGCRRSIQGVRHPRRRTR